VIPLDDRRWGELSHAYGFAADIPALLSALSTFPPDRPSGVEPWHSLWSALCHQGDVYSASFAAVPHIVEAASRDPARACAGYFLLPTCIELARIAHQFDVPDHLLGPYSAALSRFPEIAMRAAARDWDSDMCACVLAAIAVSKGEWSIAELLVKIDGREIPEVLKWYFAR
jgi:hypothetical protein